MVGRGWVVLAVAGASVLAGCTAAPPWVDRDEAPAPVVWAGQLAEGSMLPADSGEVLPAPPQVPTPLRGSGSGALVPAVSAAVTVAPARRTAPAAVPFQTPY